MIAHNKNGPSTDWLNYTNVSWRATHFKFPGQDNGLSKWGKIKNREQAKPPEKEEICLKRTHQPKMVLEK